ncbi:MAG: hypothetical protein AOA66_0770 [Candidatus Bathyarchaeota archaeon BA2]|nr:MAG: hypothetical protein AOA66_0770 [Candidatus Bathyarchaeota archaeon BA2]
MPVEFPIEYKRIKLTTVLDGRLFKICDIKEKEIGIVRKRFLYLHYDGNMWKVLSITPDLSEVEYFVLE